VWLGLLLSVMPVAAQQSTAQRPQATFETQSTIVLLDVVVRDKKGRPVRDLRPGELQVYENGQRRELTSFRLVEGQVSEERVAPAAASGLQPDPNRQVSLVTMVFDKLMDGRQLSQQAALDFLANNMESNVWVSVWTIDQRLYLRQEFTQDRYALRQAVLKATGTTSVAAASLSGEAASQEQLSQRSLAAAAALQQEAVGSAAGSSGGANNSAIGSANAEAAMAAVVASILRFTNSIQRQQQGQSSLYPLLGLVKNQSRLTGRKTLLYFSEGLVVPKNLEEVFKTAISEANRANVTVYSVDARGLSSARDSDASRDQLLQAARTSQQQMARRGAGSVTNEEVMIAENAEESLRANLQESLNEFAQSTGGFLIANTNDFKPAMARIATDIGSYYEAAYAPIVQEFDGKFRKIDVKVTRPGVTVQSRSGYFALPPGEGSALLPFEMPLLTALTVDPPPHAFEYQAQALQFAVTPEGRDHVLVFEVPLETMTFQEDPKKKLYRLRFSMLALVRDRDGRIVERFSDDYPFEGPLANLAGVKRGNLIFKRAFNLPPGDYTVDFVAQDRDSGRTSVQRARLRVAPTEGLALSSVNVVRRVEEAGAEIPLDDPFRVDRTRVIPNLDLPIVKSQNPNLSVYFVVYAKPGTTPKSALEFLQGDTLVARARPELPAADKDGRIPYVVTFPIAGFGPGRYSVRALVMDGGNVAESETGFTIVP
jgi:VWFA-related protein